MADPRGTDPGFERLQAELAQATMPVAFDDLVRRRAEVRRRRTTVTAAVCVAVVAVLAVVLLQSQRSSTREVAPVGPTPSQVDALDPDAAVPVVTSGTPAGGVFVVWQNCTSSCAPGSPATVAVRTPAGEVVLHALPRLPELITTVGEDLLVEVPGAGAGLDRERFGSDGSRGTWSVSGEVVDAQPADVAGDLPPDIFELPDAGAVSLYRPDETALHASRTPVAGGAAGDGYVSPSGTLTVTVEDPAASSFWIYPPDGSADPQAVARDLAPGTFLVTGNADHVAVVLDPFNPRRPTLLWTSDDGGRQYAEPVALASPPRRIAVGAQGSLVAIDRRSRLVRVTATGELVETGDRAVLLFSAGAALYAQQSVTPGVPLLVSYDDGATWQETPVPGIG